MIAADQHIERCNALRREIAMQEAARRRMDEALERRKSALQRLTAMQGAGRGLQKKS